MPPTGKTHFNAAPKMSNVTKTSKDSYNALQPATMRDNVAAYLLQRTIQMRTTTDKEVAAALGIPAATVSARRPEIYENPYLAYGWYWVPKLMPNKYDRQTRRTVQCWGMVAWVPEVSLWEREKLTLKILKELQK